MCLDKEWGRGTGGGAGLASYGGSKTGGHSHCTRTHQQVLVMVAILGSKVTRGYGRHGGEMRGGREGGVRRGGRDGGGGGGEGHGRSLLIHMPDITITLLIQRDTNTDQV